MKQSLLYRLPRHFIPRNDVIMFMTKKKFDHITSTAIPLDMEDVDTDQILPARFLKGITRDGFGINLFRDWRFDPEGNPKPHFILNHPNYSGEILLAGRNFGAGSSREHAAWALSDYGFNVVVSSFFADIFKNNALNNSLLPVEVSEPFLRKLFAAVTEDHSTVIHVDVKAQTIEIKGTDIKESFEINAYKKECIINGYDDVDYLRSLQKETEEFETNRKNDYSINF